MSLPIYVTNMEHIVLNCKTRLDLQSFMELGWLSKGYKLDHHSDSYNLSFIMFSLLLSTWIFLCWVSRGGHSESLLLFEFSCYCHGMGVADNGETSTDHQLIHCYNDM